MWKLLKRNSVFPFGLGWYCLRAVINILKYATLQYYFIPGRTFLTQPAKLIAGSRKVQMFRNCACLKEVTAMPKWVGNHLTARCPLRKSFDSLQDPLKKEHIFDRIRDNARTRTMLSKDFDTLEKTNWDVNVIKNNKAKYAIKPGRRRALKLEKLRNKRQTANLLNHLLTPEQAGITQSVVNGTDGRYFRFIRPNRCSVNLRSSACVTK
jgi:hypothetical protein